MGWKTACIITGDCQPGYLGTLPPHQPDRARELAAKLGYKNFEPGESCKMDDYPESSAFVIGAYDQAVFLADRDIIYKCFDDRNQDFFRAALTFYPQGSLLLVTAISTVNYFGYAYYEKGKLIREFAGSADDGVTSEIGEPLPEEESIFKDSEVRDGERLFKCEYEGEVSYEPADGVGEALAWQVMGRYFGAPYLSADSHLELQMERFKKKRKFLFFG
ncbi:MAG: hypothetical protein KC777_00565 [Cyanobacteria bacterium HKST-UBA02]|nr:hypothetical protein [Cyanobacteria bacterium HKST-UBA02]